MRTPGRHVLRFSFVAVALVLAGAGCGGRIGMPEPGTQQGGAVIDLWRVMFWTAAALGGFVLALLGWCIVRYRRRGDDGLPPQVRGNVPLEVVFFGVPLVIVAVIFVLSLRTEAATSGAGRARALRVDVTGFQWQWRFDYPAHDVTVIGTPQEPAEMVLPAGRPVRLHLHTTDVIHSFFVPGFLGKKDLIPGLDHDLRLRPVRPGRYQGYCAEFCGLNHARMNFSVRILPADEFDRWTARATGGPGR